VTLRRPAVEAGLRRLHAVNRRLRRYRAEGTERIRADEDLQWLVERGLQLGCEIVLDVGNHVLVGAFSRPSEARLRHACGFTSNPGHSRTGSAG
jgi:hypothetical protein